jgi:endonuclease/exonuclease/phosphatase family metal-dependent hydrolase
MRQKQQLNAEKLRQEKVQLVVDGGVHTCPLLSLDRVWGRPAGLVLRTSRVCDRIARIASDHLPVVAEIDVSADADWRRRANPA